MDIKHSWLHQPLLMYYQPLFSHYSPLLMDINHDKPDMNHPVSPLEPNQIHHAHRHRLPRCCGAKVQGQPKPGRPRLHNLLGAFNPSEKTLINGKDDIPYMKWKIKHVWNHQPGNQTFGFTIFFQVHLVFDVTLRCHQLHGGGNPRSKKRS